MTTDRNLATYILIGLFSGALLGLGAKWLVSGEAAWLPHAEPGLKWVIDYITLPAGQIFLRLLFMLAVPLIVTAIISSIASLNVSHFGKVGLRTLGMTVGMSTIAVVIGVVLVNGLQPGVGLPENVRAFALTSSTFSASIPKLPDASGMALIVTMFPDNPIKAAANGEIIPLMIFSILFGVGLSLTKSASAAKVRLAIEGLLDIFMTLINLVLKLAPYGVAALVFTMTARAGTDIIVHMLAYVGVVILALLIHLFGVYSIAIRWLARRSPWAFFRDVRLAMLTAFATASSNAALPTTLKVADENLRLPKHVSRFVLVAGAAMNQNGTALFEGVTVLFLAQVFGIELTLAQQFIIMGICILAGIGTAGVPAGSLPVIAMILVMFNIPVEGIGLILGVDRLLDMCRTTVNVTGDLVIASYVARGEQDMPEEISS